MQIENSNKVNLFYQNMSLSGFFPKITLPTRLSETTCTLIDNIITNNIDNNHLSGVLTRKISDHQMNFCMINDKRTAANNKGKFIEVEKNTGNAVENFQNYLSEKNIFAKMDHNIRSDPNANCDILFAELANAKQLHMPTERVKFNKRKHKVQPWMNNVLLKKINKKSDKYSKLLKIPKTDANYAVKKTEFNEHVKSVKNDIRIAKRNYYFHVFNIHRNNIKQTWNTISETLNRHRKSRDNPEKIIYNDKTLTNEQDIADSFNSFFANVGTQLSSSFEQSDSIPSFETYLDCNTRSDPNFYFTPVDEDLVLTLITNLPNKTSSGIDNISNKLLKQIKHIIVQPLTLIINQSLTSGIYPDKFKISKITPLHKKDDRTVISNYRPISLLPTMSKIIERIMHSQLYAYFNENNLIAEQQYGFRSHHSTELAALKLSDTIMCELDRSLIPFVIFLDLSKAFDTLNYKILLHKLKYYGLGNVAYNLIENYLTNRQQQVKLGNTSSKLLPMCIGVPQGSILGPLLFSICINDLPKSCPKLNCIMYADDTTLYSFVENFESNDVEREINCELDKVNLWLKANKLSLNVTKTKCMFFHKRKTLPPINLSINNAKVENVIKFNYLGFMLDECLSWNAHIEMIGIKISKAIGIINHLKFIYPQRILFTLYNSLIISHMLYGILLWGKSDNVQTIDKLQKRAIRLISYSRPLEHTEPLFKVFNLLKFNDIYTLKLLKFFYKLSNNSLPPYFDSYKILIQPLTDRYPLRRPLYQTFRVNHEFARISLKYQFVSFLNNLSETNSQFLNTILEHVHIQPFIGFSRFITNYLNSLYKYECCIRDCYVCNVING